MRPFVFAPAAQRDIESILTWTDERFGERARLRYEALLVQAITDVAEHPDLPGSTCGVYFQREFANGVQVTRGGTQSDYFFNNSRIAAIFGALCSFWSAYSNTPQDPHFE
jgi:plasmid stabilization system protein ParE